MKVNHSLLVIFVLIAFAVHAGYASEEPTLTDRKDKGQTYTSDNGTKSRTGGTDTKAGHDVQNPAPTDSKDKDNQKSRSTDKGKRILHKGLRSQERHDAHVQLPVDPKDKGQTNKSDKAEKPQPRVSAGDSTINMMAIPVSRSSVNGTGMHVNRPIINGTGMHIIRSSVNGTEIRSKH